MYALGSLKTNGPALPFILVFPQRLSPELYDATLWSTTCTTNVVLSCELISNPLASLFGLEPWK